MAGEDIYEGEDLTAASGTGSRWGGVEAAGEEEQEDGGCLGHAHSGLSEYRLLHQDAAFARLYQVDELDLALGFKFNAKGTIDRYKGETEVFLDSKAHRREIAFNMVDGDLKVFEGTEMSLVHLLKKSRSPSSLLFWTLQFYWLAESSDFIELLYLYQ